MLFTVRRELQSLEYWKAPELYTVSQDSVNSRKWNAVIKSDRGRFLAKKEYRLEIILPENYPFRPPRVRFIDHVTHECMMSCGRLNIDILGDQWSPSYSLGSILISIASVFNYSDITCQRQISRVLQMKEEIIRSAFLRINKNIDEIMDSC